jgi:hypothetical protein
MHMDVSAEQRGVGHDAVSHPAVVGDVAAGHDGGQSPLTGGQPIFLSVARLIVTPRG